MKEDILQEERPAPELRFKRRISLKDSLAELWRSRELVRSLAEREVRARYKQAALGISWAVITPVLLMIVFTLFVNRIARVDTGGVPYPIFTYLGLLPWTFFSTSVSTGGQSLVANASLMNKVYCPREVFPLASISVAGVDSLVSTIVLAVLFVVFGTAPQPTSWWVPLILLIQIAFTFGITLVVSSLLVYLRDLRHALPVILQLGLFATPVAWGLEAVPRNVQQIYAFINPIAPVIDSYRRTILMGQNPNFELLWPGALSATSVAVLGYLIFKRLETGLADVA